MALTTTLGAASPRSNTKQVVFESVTPVGEKVHSLALLSGRPSPFSAAPIVTRLGSPSRSARALTAFQVAALTIVGARASGSKVARSHAAAGRSRRSTAI